MKFGRDGQVDELAEDETRQLREFREQVRQERLDVVARAGWRELPRERLVERGWRGGLLVDPSDDSVFAIAGGVVFQPGSATLIADQTTLAYYVDADGDVVALERQPGTWSERFDRQARTEARHKAAAK